MSTPPPSDRVSLVGVDVARVRERVRQRRLIRVGLFLAVIATYLWVRLLEGNPAGWPHLPGHRPAGRDAGRLLPRPDPLHGVHDGRHRPVAARDLPAGADQRRPGRRRRHRPGQGRGRPVPPPVPGPPELRRADGRPGPPRPPVRGRPGHRQDADRQGDGGRGRRAVPVRLGHVVPLVVPGRDRSARSASTSRRCASWPAGGRRDRLHRRVRRDRWRAGRDDSVRPGTRRWPARVLWRSRGLRDDSAPAHQ